MKDKKGIAELFVGRIANTPMFFVLWEVLKSDETLRVATELLWEKLIEKGLPTWEWTDRVWLWWDDTLDFFKIDNMWHWNTWREVVGLNYREVVLEKALEKLGISWSEFINMVDERMHGKGWRKAP